MTKIILIITLSFFITSPLLADKILQDEESNLVDFNYPSHDCGEKIKKPKKVTAFKSFEDADDYNSAVVEYNIEVAEYNKDIKKYKSCINQYIKNGNHDINIIKESLNSALKEARAK